MSAYAYVGITLIVINTALFLIVFASLPMSIKRGVGIAPSMINLLTTAATLGWMWRALQWQA